MEIVKDGEQEEGEQEEDVQQEGSDLEKLE